MTEKEEFFTYEVKCRKCGKISQKYVGTSAQLSYQDFKKWASEHATFPIASQCDCDNGSMMFHDLVSYKPLWHNP